MEKARIQGSEEATKEKQYLAWRRWGTFLLSLGLHDPFLPDLSITNQCLILRAFMHATREGEFSTSGRLVAGKTTREAANNVATNFTTHGCPDPCLDISGKIHINIRHQSNGYTKSDPGTKHQAVIPPSIYHFILSHASTH
eukprot:13898071-Ditylum_brightwellii.AAC.1